MTSSRELQCTSTLYIACRQFITSIDWLPMVWILSAFCLADLINLFLSGKASSEITLLYFGTNPSQYSWICSSLTFSVTAKS